MELLLISNSTNQGESFLGYCKNTIGKILNKTKGEIIFIPFAGVTISWDEYTVGVIDGLSEFNKTIVGLHTYKNMTEAINNAAVIIVGGGNSWQLLDQLQKNNLIEPITKQVNDGVPYIGWSAGANMACPTVMTTNDMPIIQPESFYALGLIPNQINPHYTEETIPNHGGESREQRINEFIRANPLARVIGLPEGMMIHRKDDNYYILGEKKIKLFKAGSDPVWVNSDSELDNFIKGQ